jgi:hypothetical protein
MSRFKGKYRPGTQGINKNPKGRYRPVGYWPGGWLKRAGLGYFKRKDLCREPGCTRQGVRGNENLIDGRPVCDYCHEILHARPLTP